MGHAIIHFLWAQTWCAILVIALIGIGCLALRCLVGQVSSIGVAACVGLSITVFLGGLLNMAQLIYPGVLIALTLAGTGIAIAQLIRPNGNRPPAEVSAVLLAWLGSWRFKRVALLCFALLFLFRIASTPRFFNYNDKDDEPFYLAVTVKMLATHHLAADPYSERRIEGSVGGNYFLQCLVMSTLPLQNVQMADRYLGFVLLILLILALAREFELSKLETTMIAAFSISLSPLDLNLTFVVLPSALFLAMVLVAVQGELTQRPAVQALIVGLIAGALCSLKSIYMPHATLFCLILYLLRGFERDWKFALTGWAFTLLGALLIMVPWMVAMRVTCGTYLYPVLGSGYDFSAYHQFSTPFTADPVKVFRTGAFHFLPLAAIILTQVFFLCGKERSLVFPATTVAVLLGTLVTDFATGGDDGTRYNTPIVMPALVLSYFQFSWERRLRPEWKLGRFLQAGSIALLAMGIALNASRGHYSNMLGDIKVSLTDRPMDSLETRQEYAGISAALPKEGLILTTLQNPYLLNHLDERILLADWPGCAGLPPGWPIKKNGEALAEYLTSQSIRYLAYSYVGNAQLEFCLNPGGIYAHPSVRTQIQFGSYLLANKQYLELKQSRRIIYDDGKVFILDLATRAESHP